MTDAVGSTYPGAAPLSSTSRQDVLRQQDRSHPPGPLGLGHTVRPSVTLTKPFAVLLFTAQFPHPSPTSQPLCSPAFKLLLASNSASDGRKSISLRRSGFFSLSAPSLSFSVSFPLHLPSLIWPQIHPAVYSLIVTQGLTSL